jgi:hypothetical protein
MEQNKVAYYRQRISDFVKRSQQFDFLNGLQEKEFKTVQTAKNFEVFARRMGYFVRIRQTMEDIRRQHLEELERFGTEIKNETSPAEKEELASDLDKLKESSCSRRVDDSSEEEEDSD